MLCQCFKPIMLTKAALDLSPMWLKAMENQNNHLNWPNRPLLIGVTLEQEDAVASSGLLQARRAVGQKTVLRANGKRHTLDYDVFFNGCKHHRTQLSY